MSADGGVKRHTAWFVASWVFCWPIALYSLLSAWLNIDRALRVGDVAGAQHQANRVRTHGIVALCVAVVGLALFLVLSIWLIFSISCGTPQGPCTG